MNGRKIKIIITLNNINDEKELFIYFYILKSGNTLFYYIFVEIIRYLSFRLKLAFE